MADYPTLVKSYQYNVNQFLRATGTLLTDNQNLLFALYTSLTTFGSNPWTVVSSSGFGSAGAITWATNGSTHSWVVLKQAAIASNFQVLISCSNGNTTLLNVWFSPVTGFTGGTSTNDPTIPGDATQVLTNAAWGANTGDQQYRLHVLESTDGTVTRALICMYGGTSSGGICTGFLNLELPQTPVTGWTNPAHVLWTGSSSGNQVTTLSILYQTATGFGRATNNFTLFWTGENINGTLVSAAFSAPNDLNQEWVLQPIGLFSNTVGSRGRHGSLFDIWWGTWTSGFLAFSNGFPYNGATAYSFAQFGAIVLPWNGTVPLVV